MSGKQQPKPTPKPEVAPKPAAFLDRNSAIVATVVGVLLTTGLGIIVGLGGCIFTKLDDVEAKIAEIGSLKEANNNLKEFRSEQQVANSDAEKRFSDLAVKVATIESVPAQVSNLSAELKRARESLDASVVASEKAAAEVAAKSAEIEKLHASIREANKQLDALASIPQRLQAAQDGISRIRTETSLANSAATVRVALRTGSPLEDAGRFRRLRFVATAKEVPLLADPERLESLTIASARLESKLSDNSRAGTFIESRLNRQEAMVVLDVWIADGEAEAVADAYAVLQLSWFESP